MKRVIKASGDAERFSLRKVYRSVVAAGGSKETAKEAVKEVKKRYHRNMTTSEIFGIVSKIVRKEKGVFERYYLKKAIMELGPSGFAFERFFARVLDNYGYKTKVDVVLKGKRIYHEVDIVAEKFMKYMVECKYHNEVGIKTRIHPVLYTYARFLDLKKHGFDCAWLATNTKCSYDAREYAKGVGMKITSWNYPKGESLKEMIEQKRLYPVTILKFLSGKTKQRLFEMDLVLARDVLAFSPESLSKKLGVPAKQAERIIERVKAIVFR